MYIIDAKSDDKYFLVINCESKTKIKIAKSCNDLESVKKIIGIVNIKEIIK